MSTDLLIVGAGPAGLAAAVEAAGLGLSVVLLDENPGPGGRVWQALETRGAWDEDEEAGLGLIRRLRAMQVPAHFGATVWAIEPDNTVYYSRDGASLAIAARNILLATGTAERPVPIRGWTLPGVMTVGAAQIALKTGGLVPHGRTWLAGQGPLLLLYATQALKAGGQIAGIVDLSDGLAPLRALPYLTPASWPDIRRGLAWRDQLAKAGVPWIAASEVRADGDSGLRRIGFRTVDGWRQEDADLLLLHDGVIPSVQITRALGCEHAWNEAQHCWQPVVSEWGATSLPHVLVAGDGAGVGGAMAAVLSGRLAVLGLHPDTRREAAPLLAERARRLAARPFLDALFRPLRLTPDDATLVCRCEDVSAGQIRQAGRGGCQGMNQLKAYTRCGMGPCQGRMCGPVAIDVLAEVRGIPVPEVEPLRTRFPTKPVTVGELVGV